MGHAHTVHCDVPGCSSSEAAAPPASLPPGWHVVHNDDHRGLMCPKHPLEQPWPPDCWCNKRGPGRHAHNPGCADESPVNELDAAAERAELEKRRQAEEKARFAEQERGRLLAEQHARQVAAEQEGQDPPPLKGSPPTPPLPPTPKKGR